MEPGEQAQTTFLTEKHQTLEEATYQYVRRAILTGELAPGAKLSGSRLALELHVSRLTVANALKRLMSEGYVVGQPHREAVVASLDEASLNEIFLIRHALEKVVMQEVVKHITPAMLTRLHELNEQLRVSVERQDIAAHRHIEREYHFLIYAVSGLPMMTDLLIELWDRLEPYRGRRFSNLGLRSTAYTEHLAIHKALEARDGEQLVEAMHAHVERGYERSRRTLNSDLLDPDHEEVPLKPTAVALTKSRQGDPAAPGSLRAALLALPDKRRGQGKRHEQASVLAMAVCAMLCGVPSRYAVAQWGQHCHPLIRSMLGLSHDRGPSIATIHRVFHELDQAAFVQALSRWFASYGIACAEDPGRQASEEQLPGSALISSIARQLRTVLAEELGAAPPSPPSPSRHALAELPLVLLAGQSISANALIAQRELARNILHRTETTPSRNQALP